MSDRVEAPSRPVLLGVAGGSGSGKTTVVRAIVEALAPEEVSVVHHDSYYRDLEDFAEDERARVNFDHPDALETGLLVRHLRELLEGRSVRVPVYDFTTHSRTGETRIVEPTDVIIVDGILVLAEPELRRLLDIRVFVDTAPDIRFIRRMERDIRERGRSLESVVEQYTGTVRPMHLEFVDPSKRHADVIVPRGGHNQVAVDMLVTKVRAVLRERGT